MLIVNVLQIFVNRIAKYLGFTYNVHIIIRR